MKNMLKLPIWVFPILTILLFYCSWFPVGASFLIFISLVPQLIFNHLLSLRKTSFKIVLTSNFTTYFSASILLNLWISNAHWSGTIAAAFTHSILLTIPTLLFYRYIKKGQEKHALIIFILSFVSLEYIQNFWDLTWHWNNLGNVLSRYTKTIQWYKYTGASGGTFVILWINIFIYNFFTQKNNIKTKLATISMLITLLFLNTKTNSSDFYNNSIKALIYQPNLNAYTEKFKTSQRSQIDDLITKINKLDTNTKHLIITPETFIHKTINQNNIKFDSYLNYIQDKLTNNKNTILTGANTYKKIDPTSEKDKKSIRFNGNDFYKVYNSAILFKKDTIYNVYNKSKLVAGVETTPFYFILKPLLKNIFKLDLGGVSGNLGINDFAENLSDDSITLSPIICFESTFSEYVTEFTKQETELITIITNDDWWGNTAGHKHHLELAKIRAIENGKYVVRSANTGISALISDKGEIIEQLNYKTKGTIIRDVPLLKSQTFYSLNGNIIARLCTFVSVLLILQLEVVILRKLY